MADESYFMQQDLELDEKEFFEDSIKTWVNNLKQNQDDSLTPMQVMTKINESVSGSVGLFGDVIKIKGIYKAGNGTQYYGYYYDNLQDENSKTYIKILTTTALRDKIKPDSLVILNGMVTKRVNLNQGTLDILFRVDSIAEEVKSKAFSEEDLKRISLIQKKNEIGKKPVDATLRSILMRNERPKIYIIYALGSIVDKDFEMGLKAAESQIDFETDKYVSFANTSALINKIREVDNTGRYNAICLVRGGGSGMDKLDNVSLLEFLIGVKTPIIAGLGHVGELYYIKNMVDADKGTPSLLGQYFDNMVKECAQEREGTINNLVQKIEAKYKPHMERLAALEKTSKADKEQIAALLKDKQKDVDKYAKVNNDLIALQSSIDKRLLEAEKLMAGKLILWRVLAIVSLAALCFTIYFYGRTQLWWV